jgi:hypothetical protein
LESTTQTPSQEPAAELAYLLASTSANGLTIGSTFTVPEGYAGLVVANNQPFDAIGPGNYTLDAAALPQLAQKFQLRPGEAPQKRVDFTIFLLNVTNSILQWRARPLVTKNAQHGITFCDLEGRCGVKVLNPALFFSGLQSAWGRVLKGQSAAARAQFASAPIGQQAQLFVARVISSASANAMASIGAAPDQIASQSDSIKQAVASTAAAALSQIGLECTGFEVSNTPQVRRAPCAKCGSTTAPTAYGFYRRTISLLYIRFGAHQEGNYCVPCAAKVWGAYCGVMLVCGWWGIIGLVLTPVYICQNTYYFLKTAFGPKSSTGDATYATEQSGSWPPVPAEDWGQEVKDG